jgi:hypothetical protein
MIKRKQNKKTINDQKETISEYQWSKGNKTQILSVIKRKQNTTIINDQKEIEHKDSQWSRGNRTKRLSMINRALQRKLKLHAMINHYRISESQLPFVVLTISFSLTNYYFVCNKSNTTGVASGTGSIHSSVPPTCVHPRF